MPEPLPPMDNSIQNVLGLAEGQVVLELPTNLSNRSTRLLKNWFRLILAAQSTDDLPEETDGDGD